ncbi:MAG: 2-oxoglutarate dehydrogenase complex dihydrolipoyllysine-residue succinyltransferase [Bacteroidota bacterium]
MIPILVPAVGESISEVTLLKWTKQDGAYVERDEVIAELESEKATFEVNAVEAGCFRRGPFQEGDPLKIGDQLGSIDETASRPAAAPAPEKATVIPEMIQVPVTAVSNDIKATPVASAMIAENKLDPQRVRPSGPSGKILKEDVLAALALPGRKPFGSTPLQSRQTRVEKMSNLRKTISRRLVDAKNTTAMLTTFNEADMGAVMAIRSQFKGAFKEAHGVGLGFMSFFAKACAIALSEWPTVNAFIDGDTIVYHDYADISIAVSTPRGLTVPVIRNVESLGMADIEKRVAELAARARDSKLTAEELTGGTFTITNGGVFGSLMSTPILNIPQSAILGMHKIQERPMAVNGQVVIRPMMYLALSYDHRIIDGRESVGFLVRVKELLEHPDQLLLGRDPVRTLLEI